MQSIATIGHVGEYSIISNMTNSLVLGGHNIINILHNWLNDLPRQIVLCGRIYYYAHENHLPQLDHVDSHLIFHGYVQPETSMWLWETICQWVGQLWAIRQMA